MFFCHCFSLSTFRISKLKVCLSMITWYHFPRLLLRKIQCSRFVVCNIHQDAQSNINFITNYGQLGKVLLFDENAKYANVIITYYYNVCLEMWDTAWIHPINQNFALVAHTRRWIYCYSFSIMSKWILMKRPLIKNMATSIRLPLLP